MSGWGAAAAVGLDIIGKVGEYHANRRLAEENRDWQEYMSNTSYQRAAADLEAAGLNRVLALLS